MLHLAVPLSRLALAALVATACASPVVRPARVVFVDDVMPPRIVAPRATAAPPLTGADVTRAPAIGRGWLPARDGDPIAVVLTPKPGRTPTAAEVRDDVVVPLLQAIGFTPGIEALRLPPADGVASPRPRFARLARAAAHDHAANPALLRTAPREMPDVLLGYRPAAPDVERALARGEGTTLAQLEASIERREIVFPFLQVHRHDRLGAVPIEHAFLIATAWEGESIRSVQGSLLADYSVANDVALDADGAARLAGRALTSIGPFTAPALARTGDPPTLVLLPFGTDRGGRPVLRHAYRMHVDALWRGVSVRAVVWADAASGQLLALEPALKAASASGLAFNRDPGGPGTLTVPFTVDDASAGAYVLASGEVFSRLNYRGGGYDPLEEVSIAAGPGGFADFDQPPINTVANPNDVRCADPALGRAPNPYFQQVSLFATLTRQRDAILGGGIFEPFPANPWVPTVEYSSWGCMADMTLAFGTCPGYLDPQCPDAPGLLLNFAHDHTIVGHELGHNATQRLVEARPADWCAPGTTLPCTLPRGWGLFHDLADFWGAHLESTNCIGGWVGKNLGGTDRSRNCAPRHNERSGFPRKLELTAGSAAGDHFPDHRYLAAGGVDDYADGQIAGAALWEVRAGMRSRSRAFGVPQFAARFQRALTHSGFGSALETFSDDLGMYRRLLDLLFQLTEQWATAGLPGDPPALAPGGSHTTNKVTAGFARAGLFLVPWQCLDADPANDATPACPGTNPGADAVIDVDDNDPDDDDVVNGVTVVDRDFLKDAATPIPRFHVWTGPRYRLDGASGERSLVDPAPCNEQYAVDVTTDPTFATITATSQWRTVPRDPSGPVPACYAVWSPDPADWDRLRAGGYGSRVYYRVRTRDAAGGTERRSTEPGNGLWTVRPPYAIVTTDGRPDH